MFPLLIPAFSAFAGVVTTVIGGIASLATVVITYIVAKFTVKALILSSQITVSFLLITAHIATLGFLSYAIMYFYNKYNDFLSFLNSMTGASDILTIAMNILQSLGVINAFNDVFAIFSPYIIAYLVFRAGIAVFHSLQATSNELFKIGVLTQQ